MTRAWAGKLLPGKLQEQKPGPNLSVSIRHKNVLYKNCLYPANGILARAPWSQANTDDRGTEAWVGGQTHGQPIKPSSFHTIYLQIWSYFFRCFKSLFWFWRQNRSILWDSQAKCPLGAAWAVLGYWDIRSVIFFFLIFIPVSFSCSSPSVISV